MQENDFTAVILAGGKSSRFGSNKALATFQGRKLIEHPAAILGKIFTNRLLVTNSPADFEFLKWPMTGDIFTGKGPLAGIHAALHSAATPYIFAVGCDMPFPSSSLIIYLCELAPGFDGVIPWSKRGPEPLHSVFAKTMLADLEAQLVAETLTLHEALATSHIRKIPQEKVIQIVGAEKPFLNINTLADLDEV